MALSIKQLRRRALKKAQVQANLELAAPTASTTSEPASDVNIQSSDHEESSEESDESDSNHSYED